MSKEHKKIIRVFTDGSFSKNGNLTKAGYGIYFPDNEIENVARKFTHSPLTNQRTELYAIYKAVLYVNMYYTYDELQIYTDSRYSMDSLTIWIKNWKKNNWKTAGNKEVLNQDIIRKIDSLLQKFKVKFIHVKAHTGKDDELSRNNDIVDKLAKAGGNK